MKFETMEPNMIIHHRIGWKELLFYNNNPPDVPFPKGITVYNKYKEHLKNINNIFDYLTNYLFKQDDFFVIKNADFPYYVSEYITHKILWFNPKYYNNVNYEFVNNILKRKYKNYIVFENTTKNKSVKLIIHFHFFILKTNTYHII